MTSQAKKSESEERSGGPLKPVESIASVTIRMAGDSGDGIQLTGSRFSEATALAGNDLATLPDFPAEIRAPAGTLGGVSGFQLQFARDDIFTPGDRPDVLVAMNPAALKRNLVDLLPGANVIVNEDAFERRNLLRAGFDGNPLEDDTLERFSVYPIPLTTLTLGALEEIEELTTREKERCKNFFALGLLFWMYGRPMEPTKRWIERKFGEGTELAKANLIALQKGFDFGVTTELFVNSYEVRPAKIRPGTYRMITGNQASAYGFAAAARCADRPLVLGSYPITPASDILHELSGLKGYGVTTIQAEDEIASVCSVIGAAYGGALGLTTTAGPGVALKGEAIGLAVMVELPIVIANIQRGGPSTGLPTKTEQADLLMAMYGRHGEAPVPIVAPSTPGECFDVAIEAFRLATKYMTPVFFLSDGYIANGAEPWAVPDVSSLPDIRVDNAAPDGEDFAAYARDPKTLARPWAVPGTPGLEHRIGGLEKENLTGNVSYDPANHETMTHLRREKIERIADDIPPVSVFGDEEGDLLVLGWGSTWGAIRAAVEAAREEGQKVAHAHLRHLNPFPRNLRDVLGRYDTILVPEMNLGQLSRLIRAEFLVDARSYTKVQGQPFKASEIYDRIAAERSR